MKAFSNANPRDLAHAVALVTQAHGDQRSVAIAGGGSDLLGMMKERLVTPDLLIRLKSVKGLDQVKPAPGGGLTIGGLTTLNALAQVPAVRERYAVLAEAAELADEIDPQAARDSLAQADDDKDAERADSVRARARARLRAVGQTV